MTETLTIHEVAYHRNGIAGEGFYVVSFHDPEEQREMVGVVFPSFTDDSDEEWGFNEIRTAVFDRNLLGEGTIGFTRNSWRGDRYHDRLVAAIQEHRAGEIASWPLVVLKNQAATTLREAQALRAALAEKEREALARYGEIQGEVRKQKGTAQDYRDATNVGEDWQFDDLRARRQADGG